MSSQDKNFDGWIVTEKRQKVAIPPLYKVLLHNDDYTTMDFVVIVLETVFHKSSIEASKIMLNVHQKGMGIAGIYPRDIAETKVALVYDMARKNEYPLKCSIEKE